MNPTITQLAHELRHAILRWKAAGLIQFAPPAPAGCAYQKIRRAQRAQRIAAHGLSKHDPRRFSHYTPEQRRAHRLAYRRDFYRRRRQNSLQPTNHTSRL